MTKDVRDLLNSVGSPELDYQEIAAEERWEASLAKWPLLAATLRLLQEQRTTEEFASLASDEPSPLRGALPGLVPALRPVQTEPERPGSTLVVAVVSLAGGAGRTSVVANLTSALAQSGRRSMAFDLDPANALGLHFGMEVSEKLGLASGLNSGQVAAYLSRFRNAAAYLPFGACTGPQLAAFSEQLSLKPDWVKLRLAAFVPQGTEFALLDTPAYRSPLLQQALTAADQVLVLVPADAAGYSRLPAIQALLSEQLGEAAKRRVRYLINRFDGRRPLDQAVMVTLRGFFGERLLPFALQSDDQVAEGLAHRKCLVQEASDSQTIGDFHQLADWVTACAGRTEEASTPRLMGERSSS